MKTRQTIVVTGVIHSGTTMVTGILELMGIPMGGRQTNERNWEDNEIFFALKKPEEFKPIVTRKNAKHEVWGFKRPNVTAHFNMLRETLVNPHFFVIFRDSVACTLRNHKREDGNFPAAVLINIERQAKAMRRLSGNNEQPDVTILSYEKALVRPKELVDIIVDKLVISPKQEKIDKAVAHVQPEFGFRDLTKYLRELK